MDDSQDELFDEQSAIQGTIKSLETYQGAYRLDETSATDSFVSICRKSG